MLTMLVVVMCIFGKISDAVQPRHNRKIIGELEDDVILDQDW